MLVRLSALVVIGLLAVGCSTTASAAPTQVVSSAPSAVAGDPAALDAVRGWVEALNAGDLETAASFFAPGARVGPELVETNSTEELVAVLRDMALCRRDITSLRQDGATVFASMSISGETCEFLEPGTTSREIEIPVHFVDGKIVCTCPEGM